MDELMALSISLLLVVVRVLVRVHVCVRVLAGAKAASEPLNCEHDANRASRTVVLWNDGIVDGAAVMNVPVFVLDFRRAFL